MKNMVFRKVLYGISILALIGTIGGSILLPYLANYYLSSRSLDNVSIATLIFIYTTIVPFLLILCSVIKLSKNLMKDDSFLRENLNELKVITICSFVDFIIYLIGTTFIFKNLVCFVLTFATLMVFIISYVIKELIKNGIEIKEENDLTI